MSEQSDHSAAIARMERRLSRERSARLQAEAIAERVASDRWELRQQLEEKLALRTSELEAARRAASEAVTERQRCMAKMSHDLRTSLTALFYLAETLSAAKPVTVDQLEELRNLLADMRTVMDAAAGASSAVNADAMPEGPARVPPQMSLADIVSAHEGNWHQVAARSGKLLILDVDTASSGQSHAGTSDEVNQYVLNLIRTRAEGPEPVIELHLAVGPSGLELR